MALKYYNMLETLASMEHLKKEIESGSGGSYKSPDPWFDACWDLQEERKRQKAVYKEVDDWFSSDDIDQEAVKEASKLLEEASDNGITPEEILEAVVVDPGVPTRADKTKRLLASIAAKEYMLQAINPPEPKQLPSSAKSLSAPVKQPPSPSKPRKETTCRTKVFDDPPARRQNEEKETNQKGLFRKILSRLFPLCHNPYREL